MADTPSDARAVIGQEQPQTQSPPLAAKPDPYMIRDSEFLISQLGNFRKTPQRKHTEPFMAKLRPHMASKKAKAHRSLAAGQSDGADHSPATKAMN